MKKKLIIFGSSVAYGEGAKNNQGWADIISNKYLKSEWEVINKSVCGNRVKHLLNRVNKDVLNLYPDAVIIAISLGNEGLTRPFKKCRYNRFIKGIKKLLDLFYNNKIIPIITNIYPNNYYKKVEYAYLQKMNIELDQLGVNIVNVSGTVDDLEGKWLSGMYYDSGHPNDLGHYEMSTAFSYSLFKNIEKTIDIIYKEPKFTKHINKKFHIIASNDFSSYTICFDVLSKDGIILNIKETISIFSEKNRIVLTNNDEKLTLSISNKAHLLLMYHPQLKELNICVNSVRLYSINKANIKIDEIIFNGKSSLFNNLSLYRGRLSKKIREYIYQNNFFGSSIELFSNSKDIDKLSNQINSEAFIEAIN